MFVGLTVESLFFPAAIGHKIPIYDEGTLSFGEPVVLANDISSDAMRHLDRRLDQIRKGKVRLNTAEDEKWWNDNAALPIYALNDSPLLRLFMHPEAEEGAL